MNKNSLIMDVPFDYSRPIVGDDFLSRKMEVNTLTNMLKQKQNVLIYDAPKTGKKSLVSQTFLNLQKSSYNYVVCDISLLNVRDPDVMFRNIAKKIGDSFSNAVSSYEFFLEKYLPDVNMDSSSSLTGREINTILSLPEKICSENDINIIVYFEEFQNILLFDDPDAVLKILENEWPKHENVTYLITGSRINAMKYIFEEQKYFYHFAEYIHLSPLDEKAVTDRIIKVFLKVGRVIDQDLASKIYTISEGNPFYMWQIASFCFDLTKGYMNENIMNEALCSTLSVYDPSFRNIMNGLSNFQVSFLKAIFDGVTRFSSVEIISEYRLNSSANVHRLKEALKKKEIVAFNENDDPYIIDPFFKYWLANYYFLK